MCQALLEIMEPEINKIVGQVKEEANQTAKKEAEETAAKLIQSQKLSLEEIHQCVPRLTIKDIQKIAAELANA